MAALNLLNYSKNFFENTRSDLRVNKNIYTAIVDKADMDNVFLVPQNYSFITVQIHSLEGISHVDYTASDIKLIPNEDESTLLADWMPSYSLKDVATSETKIEGVEHMVTAVRIRTNGKCRAVLVVKDSI